MLGEYKVNRCTRRCHAEDRPLREGESYYSVVIESGDDYERRDYSASAWTQPPEGAVGWWKNRMPKSTEKKMVLAPNEVLVDLLRQMGAFPEKAASRYLLALMLMRRKIVRPSQISPEDAIAAESTADSENAQAGETLEDREESLTPNDAVANDLLASALRGADSADVIVVEVIVDGSLIVIPTCRISRQQSESLRDELNELLYCEAEEES